MNLIRLDALVTGFGDMLHSPFLLVGYGPFVVFILDMKFFKSYITQIKAMSVTIYQCTDASRYFLLRLTNLLNKPFWKYVKSKRTDNVRASGIKKNGILHQDSKTKENLLNDQFKSEKIPQNHY